MSRVFSYVLLPFSLLYGAITSVRNFLYNSSIFKSYQPPVPSIVVGNLVLGGAGKTPHTEYLARLLKNQYKVAILSRGYGRKTKGFIEVNEMHTALEVGDEPLQYYSKFKNEVSVSVCENRTVGIKTIVQHHPDTDVILLDDAFQHRKIKAGLNILISEFNRPFFNDFVIPAGRLREFRCGQKRSQLIVYSKCSSDITDAAKEKYIQKSSVGAKHTYFSSVQYGEMCPFHTNTHISSVQAILLVTGIAHPYELEMHLKKNYQVKTIRFADHHNFTRSEIQKVHEIFDKFAAESTLILTTEKDFMRLKSSNFSEEMSSYPWHYVPITVQLDKSIDFEQEIIHYVEQNRRRS